MPVAGDDTANKQFVLQCAQFLYYVHTREGGCFCSNIIAQCTLRRHVVVCGMRCKLHPLGLLVQECQIHYIDPSILATFSMVQSCLFYILRNGYTVHFCAETLSLILCIVGICPSIFV